MVFFCFSLHKHGNGPPSQRWVVPFFVFLSMAVVHPHWVFFRHSLPNQPGVRLKLSPPNSNTTTDGLVADMSFLASDCLILPISSGIFTYIYHKNPPNVGKYAIHGWYGFDIVSMVCWKAGG